MKKKPPSYRAALLAVLGIFLTALAIKNAEIAANGIKKGLSLTANMLLPSLFPFLVISELTLALGTGKAIAALLARPARLLFGLTPNGTVVLTLGWLCGVPVGTVCARSMLERGELSRVEFDRLLLFSNTPSTGFLIGAVGTVLFGSRALGIALFFSCLLSSMLTGILLKLFGGNLPETANKWVNGSEKRLDATVLTTAVRHAVSTLLQVVGLVLFFSAVCECVAAIAENAGLPRTAGALLSGVLELTAGTAAVAAAFAPRTAFLLAAFFAGFSGLSICLQIFAVAQEAQPKPLPYLAVRLFCGMLAAALAALYVAVTKPVLQTSCAGFWSPNGQALQQSPSLSLSLALAFAGLVFICPRAIKWRVVTFYTVKEKREQ